MREVLILPSFTEFGNAVGINILVTEVDCNGDEDLLTDCPYRTDIDNSVCNFGNTAGVVCAGGEYIPVITVKACPHALY